jgi:hypothetical protein
MLLEVVFWKWAEKPRIPHRFSFNPLQSSHEKTSDQLPTGHGIPRGNLLHTSTIAFHLSTFWRTTACRKPWWKGSLNPTKLRLRRQFTVAVQSRIRSCMYRSVLYAYVQVLRHSEKHIAYPKIFWFPEHKAGRNDFLFLKLAPKD